MTDYEDDLDNDLEEEEDIVIDQDEEEAGSDAGSDDFHTSPPQ